ALTGTNYVQLQALYTKYYEHGLRVLAFPCNQFGGQEPGTDAQIKEHVQSAYNVTFDLFHKVDVNGDDAIPLYNYLTSKKRSPFFIRRIEWNFVKFLVDRSGIPYDRYAPTTSPNDMLADILALLGQ
ncbi:glutathione peroxidase, partial [Clonorchis sinensis]